MENKKAEEAAKEAAIHYCYKGVWTVDSLPGKTAATDDDNNRYTSYRKGFLAGWQASKQGEAGGNYKNALEEIIHTTASKAYTPFQKVNRCYDIAAFALSSTPSKHRGDEGTLKLTKKDAENWLTDELEGEQSGTFSFYEVVELLHDYFVEANKAIANEAERLSSTPPKLSGDEKGMRWRAGNDFPKDNGVYITRLIKLKRVSACEYVKEAGGWNTSYPPDMFEWLDESSPKGTETVDSIRVQAAKDSRDLKASKSILNEEVESWKKEYEAMRLDNFRLDKEVERLKGLIEAVHKTGWDDAIRLDDNTIQLSWQIFSGNNL